jgi:tetratricopeptide (TPR) repeat protein
MNKIESAVMNSSIIPLLFFLLSWQLGLAQSTSELLNKAHAQAVAGNHVEAEKTYSLILSKAPDNLEALAGSGHNFSWNKEYDQARIRFERALSVDTHYPDALLGLAYNYARSGNFEASEKYFLQLQQTGSAPAEAEKGLAYLALWRGRSKQAIQAFLHLAQNNPSVVEYRVALGQAYLLDQQTSKARIALQSALQIEPGNRTANELLEASATLSAPFELDVWSGFSQSDSEKKFALRTVQITTQMNPKLRMYLKYDNSLTADLAALVRANQEAQALSIGGVAAWNRTLTTRLESGLRILPDNITQTIISGEQVYFIPGGYNLKIGGFLGVSQKVQNEWLTYLGTRIPLTPWYALEPYYFRSKVANAPRTENRFMLNNHLRSKTGYELNLGLYTGQAGVEDTFSDKRLNGVYASAVLPVSTPIWALLSIRWEQTPLTKLTVLAAGVKVRFEK